MVNKRHFDFTYCGHLTSVFFFLMSFKESTIYLMQLYLRLIYAVDVIGSRATNGFVNKDDSNIVNQIFCFLLYVALLLSINTERPQ